jgi:hypothetical protein
MCRLINDLGNIWDGFRGKNILNKYERSRYVCENKQVSDKVPEKKRTFMHKIRTFTSNLTKLCRKSRWGDDHLLVCVLVSAVGSASPRQLAAKMAALCTDAGIRMCCDMQRTSRVAALSRDEMFFRTDCLSEQGKPGRASPTPGVSTFPVRHHPAATGVAPPHPRRGAFPGSPPDSGGAAPLARGGYERWLLAPAVRPPRMCKLEG